VLPTVRSEAGPAIIADGALRAGLTHRAYLADVLAAEVDDRRERRRERRVADAQFSRIKRLAEFDCSRSLVNEATFAAGSFIERGDPIVLLGDSGTGKSHLLIGTGMAATETGCRVRYIHLQATCGGRMRRESHVRSCESRGGSRPLTRIPPATRLRKRKMPVVPQIPVTE